MKKILLFLLIIPLLFTSGCSSSNKDYKIYEGYVVDKIYDEGYTYTTYIQSGKVRVPIIHHVPDKYYVVIYKEEKITKHSVSKEFYDNFTVGSYVVIGTEDLGISEELSWNEKVKFGKNQEKCN